MIEEKGYIVAVEKDAIWVETIQKSTCGTCVAEKGCGQTLLKKIGVGQTHIRVLLLGKSPDDFHINDTVTLGIPDDVVVQSSLLAYLMPLIVMFAMGAFAESFFQNELITILMSVLGLVFGGLLLKLYSRIYRDDSRKQPVIIENNSINTISMNQ